jgi:hypothetical protein
MLKTISKQAFTHWQSTLFGCVSALGVALAAATAQGNLTAPQLGAVVLTSGGLFLKGLVSADAAKL